MGPCEATAAAMPAMPTAVRAHRSTVAMTPPTPSGYLAPKNAAIAKKNETCRAARPMVPARRPTTRLARWTGATSRRSKNPRSMSPAHRYAGRESGEQRPLDDFAGHHKAEIGD